MPTLIMAALFSFYVTPILDDQSVPEVHTNDPTEIKFQR